MSVLPLIQLEKKIFKTKNTPLREESKIVENFGEDFQKIVDDLIETFHHHKIAVGLAAPQVGIGLKVAVVNIEKEKDVKNTLVIVNPKVTSVFGKRDKKKEACMSLPHYQGEVERRHKIEISHQDRFGKVHTLSAKGFLARVLTHEIDHLEGFLYIDKMSGNAKLEPVEFFKENKKT